MALDPTIALGVKPPQFPQPLELAGQLQDLRKRANENLLFDLQNTARQRIGAMMAQPEMQLPGGGIDYDKLRQSVFRDPNANFLAREMDAWIQDRQQKEYTIMKTQAEGQLQVAKSIGATLAPLLAQSREITQDDVHRAASQLLVQFGGNSEFAKQVILGLKNAPRSGPELKQWVEGQMLAATNAEERIKAMFPEFKETDLGGQKVFTQTPTVGAERGQTVVGGVLSKGLTPEGAAEVVPMKDAEGNPVVTNKGQLTSALEAGGRIAPRSLPAGPSEQRQAELTTETKQFTEQMAAANNMVDQGDKVLRELSKMGDALQMVRTGQFANARTTLAAMAKAVGLPDSYVGMLQGGNDEQTLANTQFFMKLVWTQAFQTLKSLVPAGTQITEAEVLRNFENNPNLVMDRDAILKLMNALVANQKYAVAQRDFLRDWQKTRGDKQLSLTDALADWRTEALKRGLVKEENFTAPKQEGVVNPRGFTPPPGLTMDSMRQFEDKLKPGAEGVLKGSDGNSYRVRRGHDGRWYNVQ